MSFLGLSSKNLLRNPGRNAALALAIVFGYAGVVLVAGLITRWEKYLRYNTLYLNHVGSLSIYKRDGLENFSSKPKKFSLTSAEQKKILDILKPMPEVEFVGRYLNAMGLVSNGCKTAAFVGRGIEPAVEQRVRTHPLVEKWSPELRSYSKGKGMWEYPGVNGLSLSEGLALKIGKPLVLDEVKTQSNQTEVLDCLKKDSVQKIRQDSTAQIIGTTFSGFLGLSEGQVVNHFSTGFALTNDSHLKMPLSELQSLLDSDAVTYIGVFLRDGASVGRFEKRVQTALAKQGVEADVYTYQDEKVNPIYTGDLSFLTMLGGFTLLIMSTVIVLSVLNFLTITILERTREVGTLRAIGFSPSQIARIFLVENLVLTFVALAMGSGVVFVSHRLVNLANIRFRTPGVAGTTQLMLTPTVPQCVALGAFVIVLVSVSTFVFAKRRASMNVYQLLSSTFE